MTSSARHANNYKGLKQRQSYDEIVDYLNNKQEKIIFPTRLAKSLRNSNQLSNLLDGDGEGLINMELQQQNIIKEQQKEHAITAMTDAKSTAKVTKIMATQTKLVKQSEARSQTANPKFKVSETQTAKVYKGSMGVQTQVEPLTYDLTAQDDKSEQLANDIVMESQHQSQQVKKRKGKIVNLLVEHFENISPGSMNIAHVMASSSSMASSSHIPPNMEGIQLNEPNKRSPEEEHEPKGRRGRPRKTQQSEMPPEPMLIDKELKRPQKPSPPQSPKKSKKTAEV